MHNADYAPPLDKLLTYGDCRDLRDWPDYLALGLRPDHIPDLIRMATDDDLSQADSESLEVWAPAHAWRALGQLRAEAAVTPLLGTLRRIDEQQNDLVAEDLPEVFGLIGPIGIPALAIYLADRRHKPYARVAAAHSLKAIGQRHPSSRAECVAALTRQLEQFGENDPTINSFAISYLMDLKAVEAAPVIERAFNAQRVDISVMGDWEDVQIDLGLKAQRSTPRPHYGLAAFLNVSDGSPLAKKKRKRGRRRKK